MDEIFIIPDPDSELLSMLANLDFDDLYTDADAEYNENEMSSAGDDYINGYEY